MSSSTNWYWWSSTMLLLVVLVVYLFAFCSASVGDRSTIYNNCTSNCTNLNCTVNDRLYRYLCIRNCQYECMWPTVDDYYRQFNSIPQFFGKWPFVRFATMQEPASTIFSAANLFTFYRLFKRINRLPTDAPFRTVWRIYALIGMMTWTFSMMFHWHDTIITERLDYFSAFAAIVYGLFACALRVTTTIEQRRHRHQPTRRSTALVAIPLLIYYIYHIGYLSIVHFDYAYNMKANVIFGIITSILWICWCIIEWWNQTKEYDDTERSGMLFYCLLTVACGSFFLVFELFDFAPIVWTFDAHSLWHLSTIPLPLFWSKFVVADCRQLRRSVIRYHQA